MDINYVLWWLYRNKVADETQNRCYSLKNIPTNGLKLGLREKKNCIDPRREQYISRTMQS